MHREYRSWFSPSLGREMELLVFGHGGIPILAFPSSLGRFHEWEDFGMVGALHSQLSTGANRLICVDSVDSESFYNKNVDPYVRISRHKQYDRYIVDEVVPFIRDLTHQFFIIATGASFGAYHAANVVFKYPGLFGKLIALSGSFDIRSFLDGFYDDNVYFNNPLDYLSNLENHEVLESIRHSHIILALGEFDPCRPANERLSWVLNAKGIPHTFDMVPSVFGHDWPYWRDMMVRHVA